MRKCKAKAIQTYLGTFSNNEVYARIIQAYLCTFIFIPCVTRAYLEALYIQSHDIKTRSIFRTLAYLQRWYIQNLHIFKTMTYSKYETYSQQSMIKRFAKIVNSYN